MATVQLSRNDTQLGRWESVFPNEQVTEVQSTLFVKKLLAVAVSSITYLRALFPEAAYGNRCVEEVNLKILRDDSTWPDACKVIQWLRGCFDALEKKYLRGVLVGIYDDPEDPDTVIEQYTFKFAYGDGNGLDLYRNGVKIMSTSSDKETKKATIRLLRTIVILSQTLAPLPDDVYMTMKLIYYDEVTPADYDPPGFKQSESDDFAFKDEPMSIKVGDVSTNFHSFKLRIKTVHHELQTIDGNDTQVVYHGSVDCKETQLHYNGFVDDVNQNAKKRILGEAVVPAANDVMMLSEEDEESSIYPPLNEIKHSMVEQERKSHEMNSDFDSDKIPLDEAPVKSPYQSTGIQDLTVLGTVESVSTDELKTFCPCGINEDDGLMILCAICNSWQHATCFGILDPTEAPIVHYCVECSKKSSYLCTDRYLSKIEDPVEIREHCLWRRTLLACTEFSRVVPAALSKRLGVPVSMGSSLIQRLENEGFVKAGGKAKRFGKLVQKKEIEGRGYVIYFKYGNAEQNEDMNLAQETSKMEISEGSEASYRFDGPQSMSEKIANNKSGLTFELNDSQVTSPKKRRKASVSADPMCV